MSPDCDSSREADAASSCGQPHFRSLRAHGLTEQLQLAGVVVENPDRLPDFLFWPVIPTIISTISQKTPCWPPCERRKDSGRQKSTDDEPASAEKAISLLNHAKIRPPLAGYGRWLELDFWIGDDPDAHANIPD
jgi:hypothetical protein